MKSLKMIAEAGDTDTIVLVGFEKHVARVSRLFCRTSFFIAIGLRICGGGSAPHFAAKIY